MSVYLWVSDWLLLRLHVGGVFCKPDEAAAIEAKQICCLAYLKINKLEPHSPPTASEWTPAREERFFKKKTREGFARKKQSILITSGQTAGARVDMGQLSKDSAACNRSADACWTSIHDIHPYLEWSCICTGTVKELSGQKCTSTRAFSPTDTNIKHADVVVERTMHWQRAVAHNPVACRSADPSLYYTVRNGIVAWLEADSEVAERRTDSEG
ncbi:hypothetical protein T310_1239 [Rasamsonia emersonii CBS 393.64]|uniref:Uncharacterized protein n=1 Tax=Rasamsonia emersonii (strain ATCC 16479 / CBS 393.64 / IMI 116815) TaxID=1408163 RepID=A0A0F4Z2M6_RASE3|nr:hypothetical protein T310_1239 [Rasamsonia emersonii CBS 393.64]KKA24774.1 hypothetical protein T310_1239 [Rasamsonia emersonii CBS 393.64]